MRPIPAAPLTALVALNGTPQVEYSYYMDLRLADAADAPLREAFARRFAKTADSAWLGIYECAHGH